jgi:phosphoribosyl-ATP pyrophosphohydrolase/phosphoribosyl-AMP cyclohydrolase
VNLCESSSIYLLHRENHRENTEGPQRIKTESKKLNYMNQIDFEKGNGLVPAVIQDNTTLQVLMVGFMNEEALKKTIEEGRVTFFSRSKNRLWTKGETSGNFLTVKELTTDCDNDSLLIKVDPAGPVCHKGTTSCFNNDAPKGFLYKLEQIVNQRIDDNVADSYTNKIYKKGINKAAQKVGEEAVELIIEAKDNNIERFKNEAADLLYHMLILLKVKNVHISDIEEVLYSRHKPPEK